MRYKIKKIESQEKTLDKIWLFAGVAVYLLCFILSEMFSDYDFAEWIFFQYKKLPK